MSSNAIVGFISLGVMAQVMYRNLALKGDAEVAGYDIRSELLARLGPLGIWIAGSMSQITRRCNFVFLSPPKAEHEHEFFNRMIEGNES